MNTGNAGGYFEFFPEELISVGMQLTLDAWAKLAPTDKAGKEGFSIHFQAIPLAPDGPVAARIDFKFLAGFDEDAYFAFEAKRLRIQRKSKIDFNTQAYVGAEGMERFISGKYAPAQLHGAMLGYVMDGDVLAATSAVKELVSSSQKKLKLVTGGEWENSFFLPDATNINQTRHLRTTNVGNAHGITLQHIFLAA